MEKQVPLLGLLTQNPHTSIRKVDYIPEASKISFDHHRTGCSLSNKDRQEAQTENGHVWYPFTMVDGAGKNVLCIVPDAVPKFKLCLEGWAGYFDQLSIIAQFTTELYGNKKLNAVGIPLSPTAIRAMARVYLLELIKCDTEVWVGTYAKPDMGSRMLKLQYMNKLSGGQIERAELYDLDKGKSYRHEASILPIIRLPSTTTVDEHAFHEGGALLKLTLPKDTETKP